MTSSTKQAYKLAMLGARTLKHNRDVSYDHVGKGHGQGHHDLYNRIFVSNAMYDSGE